MKTTVEIDDALMRDARELAHREGRTFRSVLEEALHQLLKEHAQPTEYEYQDCSVGEGWLLPEHRDRPLRDLIRESYDRPIQ